jgi:hypothetical protein
MPIDLLTGLWALDVSASQFSTPSPVAWTLDISAQQTGMTVNENIARADGTTLRVTFAPQFDGRYYPVQGSPVMDSISFVRQSERLLEVSAQKAGRAVFSVQRRTGCGQRGRCLPPGPVTLRHYRSRKQFDGANTWCWRCRSKSPP